VGSPPPASYSAATGFPSNAPDRRQPPLQRVLKRLDPRRPTCDCELHSGILTAGFPTREEHSLLTAAPPPTGSLVLLAVDRLASDAQYPNTPHQAPADQAPRAAHESVLLGGRWDGWHRCIPRLPLASPQHHGFAARSVRVSVAETLPMCRRERRGSYALGYFCCNPLISGVYGNTPIFCDNVVCKIATPEILL
jgi:hypothetical protein